MMSVLVSANWDCSCILWVNSCLLNLLWKRDVVKELLMILTMVFFRMLLGKVFGWWWNRFSYYMDLRGTPFIPSLYIKSDFVYNKVIEKIKFWDFRINRINFHCSVSKIFFALK